MDFAEARATGNAIALCMAISPHRLFAEYAAHGITQPVSWSRTAAPWVFGGSHPSRMPLGYITKEFYIIDEGGPTPRAFLLYVPIALDFQLLLIDYDPRACRPRRCDHGCECILDGEDEDEYEYCNFCTFGCSCESECVTHNLIHHNP